jgi:hypothetical protein
MPVQQILLLLRATAPRLAAATADLTPAELRARPSRNEWSANEGLAHVRACADVWGKCIETMVAEDRPTIRAIGPRSWVKKTNYRDIGFRPSLRAFERQRARLLPILEGLPPKGWSRSATITGAGAPLRRTVLNYASAMARHERAHVKQIERIVRAMRG